MGYDDDASRKRKKIPEFVDDIAEEDSSAEEEDEDDLEEQPSHSRYKRRIARYIEEETAVDYDMDEADEEDGGIDNEEELIDSTVEASAKPSHYRRYEADRDSPEDPDQLEEYIRKRYQTPEYTVDGTTANEQSLLPTTLDPKLWVIQCRPGFERKLCLGLMNKYLSFKAKKTPLLIRSAISLDHLKGYFYVESESEANVRNAISGIRNILHAKPVKRVPLQEMVAAITPNRVAKLPITEGSWVRIRSGPYAQDLGKVIHINHATQKVDLKVVPRIDYTEMINRQEGRYMSRNRDPFGKKSKVRPAAKPFNAEECRALGLVVERRRGINGEVYMSVGNYIFQDGYLIKTLSTRSILVEEGGVPVEEIERFKVAARTNSEQMLTPSKLPESVELPQSKSHGLFKGDSVRVLQGDMTGMTGIVTDTTADGMIEVVLDSKDLRGAVPIMADHVVKRFDLGDHVHVKDGVKMGQLGMVIKIEEHKCLILSDLDKGEFWVAAKDLSRTESTSFGQDYFGEFEVGDLVELKDSQFGVIVFADRDFCNILSAGGSAEKPEIKRVTLQEIQCRCDARRNITTDRFGNRVGSNDVVDFAMNGKSTSGTVKYVSSSYLFVKLRQKMEHLGFVAISAKACAVRGGYRGPSDQSGVRGRGRGRGRCLLKRRGRASYWESVMVKVVKGAHRGYRGRIKDETATHVRVELDAGSKVITIPKENVEVVEADQEVGRSKNAYWNNRGESISGPPKTPYGESNPPTTPYMNPIREAQNSPSYTPVGAPEGEVKEDPVSTDDEMRFGEEEPEEPATEEVEESGRALQDLTGGNLVGLVVGTGDGRFGVTRGLGDDGTCEVEIVRRLESSEGRRFEVTGEKVAEEMSGLKLVRPAKGDYVRIMEGVFGDALGQLIAVDGDDCITRLGEEHNIQIFAKKEVAVTLSSQT